MPDYGQQVHQVVRLPFAHPMSGKRMYLLANVTDRIVSEEQALKLNRWYNRKAAQGSFPMSGGI